MKGRILVCLFDSKNLGRTGRRPIGCLDASGCVTSGRITEGRSGSRACERQEACGSDTVEVTPKMTPRKGT